MCTISLNSNSYAGTVSTPENRFSVIINFHKVVGGIEVGFIPSITNTITVQVPAQVYYTLDGSDPKNGILSKGRVFFNQAKTYTIRVIAINENSRWSSEKYATFTIKQLSVPIIESIQAGEETIVNISAEEGATIYYTTDSSNPTVNSTEYTEEITLTEDTQIKAVAVKEGCVTSNVAQEYALIATLSYLNCSECGKEISTEDTFYDGDDVLCEECYNEATNTIEPSDEKQECSVCSESFDIEDLIFDDDDNAFCQDCYNELSDEESTYIECIYCGEVFEENEDILDEYGNVVCPYCDEIIVYSESYEDYDDDYDEYEEDDYDEDEEYEDIDFITSDWAYDEVCEAYRKDLIPREMLYDELDEEITREEFCAIAVKLYESLSEETVDADTGGLPFTDCDYSDYISYIAIAYELGITNGTSRTTFSPYDNISREQLATMLYRVINCVDSDYTEYFDLRDVRKFNDDSKISVYAKEGVYFLAEIGAVKGVLNGNFAPAETATKEQAILISLRCTETDNSFKY